MNLENKKLLKCSSCKHRKECDRINFKENKDDGYCDKHYQNENDN